jgi:hypothetical protein
MAPLHRYVTCGLDIASDVAVPGLPSGAGAGIPDVHVFAGHYRQVRASLGEERVRYVSPECLEDGVPQLTVWTDCRGAHRLRYADGTEFIVDQHAARVDVEWKEPLTAADAAVYLLGPVLGFVMRLRGIVPLHASAVMIGGGATAFVGDAWAGKSTTAAAFAALGHQVLSDDLLPVVEAGGAIVAHPSHPRITMWPDSAHTLFGVFEDLPMLTPTYDKRYFDLQPRELFQSTPAPLEVIYVLGHRAAAGARSSVEPMSPRSALMTLVSHTYGNYLLDAPMRAREFDILSRLVQHVSVRQLTFADDISQLIESCRRLAKERLQVRPAL